MVVVRQVFKGGGKSEAKAGGNCDDSGDRLHYLAQY